MRNTYFITLTINGWIPIFTDYPETIFIMLNSFSIVRDNYEIRIYAFVVMKDHIHLIINTTKNAYEFKNVIALIKSYTAKSIIKYLKKLDKYYLEKFYSDRKDRNIKIWKLNSHTIQLMHRDIIYQKIKYIHLNPTKGEYKSCDLPYDYYFSSAKSYFLKKTNFPFLTIFNNISQRGETPSAGLQFKN